MTPPTTEPPAPTRVDGALTAGTPAATSNLAMTEAGQQLELLGGALAVAGAETMYRLDLGALTALPVGGDGEAMTTGPVHHLARRGSGLFVVAEGGIFHDANGRLLRSPLSDDVPGANVRALDDLGTDADEELWLVTTDGLTRARASVLTAITLTFPGVDKPDLAVAVEKNKAVVLASNQLFSVDLNFKEAKWEAKDLPPVAAVARGDDGTVYLATAKGLYARSKDGTVKLYSFAAAGAEPKAVADVFSAYGETLVAVDGAVGLLGGATFGALTAAKAHGLARDAAGDTFVLDGSNLVKLATGKPVTFAADVKPFFAAHCTVCHATGANNTPVIIDFTDYATVVAKANLIVTRLTATGIAPMPPPNTEVLSSNDYAVVLRWVAGGEQP